jgi:branched-chain amino acid transport system substrate-binding protein
VRRLLTLCSLLATTALISVGCGGDDSSSDTTTTTAGGDGSTTEVTFGALLDLSGPGKSLGEASRSALEAAVEQARADGVEVTLDVRDSRSDPETALQEMEALHHAGVRVVIGPQTSSEAREVLQYSNDNGMLVISQGSTAGSLAIDGDALYRMIPTDQVEGAASGDLIADQGPVKVITVNRDDTGNQGLVDAVSKTVEARGGTAIDGPTYPTEGADWSSVVGEISQLVDQNEGEQPVVVYVAGFDEVAELLAAADARSELAEIAFYGGDGSAKVAPIIDDAAAARFAAGPARGFPSPLPTIDDDAVAPPEALSSALPSPDPLAFAAYDALIIAAEAVAEVGADAEGAPLRQAFAAAAAGHRGVSGTIDLDAAGDRATMPFAFWGVCDVDGTFEWRDLGTWVPPTTAGEAGVIAYLGCRTGGVGSGAPTP